MKLGSNTNLSLTFFFPENNLREIGRGACSYVWVGAKSEGNQRLAALKLHWYENLLCNIICFVLLGWCSGYFWWNYFLLVLKPHQKAWSGQKSFTGGNSTTCVCATCGPRKPTSCSIRPWKVINPMHLLSVVTNTQMQKFCRFWTLFYPSSVLLIVNIHQTCIKLPVQNHSTQIIFFSPSTCSATTLTKQVETGLSCHVACRSKHTHKKVRTRVLLSLFLVESETYRLAAKTWGGWVNTCLKSPKTKICMLYE